MQFGFRLITTVILLIITVTSATAKPIPAVNSGDQNITDLSNRLNSLISYWDRFQIGGELTFKAGSRYQQARRNLEQLNFTQQLDLYFNAMIDSQLGTAIKLTHYGCWGEYSNTPMNSSLQLDEAYLSWNAPSFLAYLGRFHFSLNQLGLVSDFTTNAAEGAAFQRVYRNFHVIGLYSRVYTLREATTGNVASAEDYWAARWGWSNRNHVVGLNLVPDGIAGETDFSIDWSTAWSDGKLAIEAAWHSFDSAGAQLSVTRVPGILASFSKVYGHTGYFQIKAGYFAPDFQPQYSSLAHISGDNREWFIPNSRGIEALVTKEIKPGWNWENRLIVFQPVNEYGSPKLNYRFATTVIRNFSPVNQLQLGIDRKSDYAGVDGSQLVVSWNLRF
jgi:hypothetical protein